MYTVNVLSDKSFDNLDTDITKGSQISDSLGFADPETKQAYVRYTHLPELQRFLVDHEMDELVMHESGHEDENGIRHKKARQVFGNIAPIAGPLLGAAIPGLGPVLGAGLGGLAGGALKGGIGGEKRSVSGALKGGALGGAGGAAAGFLGSKLLPKAASGIGNFFGFGGGGGSAAAAAGGGGGSGGGSAFNPLALGAPAGRGVNVGFGTPAQVAQAASNIGQPQGILNRFGSLVKQNPLRSAGLGVALGSQFLRSPKVPELPQSAVDFQQLARQQSGIGAQGTAALSGLLGEQFQPLSEAEIEGGLRQFRETRADQRDQLINVFKSLRPGTDPLTDTTFGRELSRFDEETARNERDFVANRTRDLQQNFDQQRLQQILASQGIDQQRLAGALQAANFDVERVIGQFNVDDRDREFLRNYLFQFGGDLVAGTLGDQQPSTLSQLNNIFQTLGFGGNT